MSKAEAGYLSPDHSGAKIFEFYFLQSGLVIRYSFFIMFQSFFHHGIKQELRFFESKILVLVLKKLEEFV